MDNLGNNVQPPKDVQEKEQFHKLHQWIREVLCTEHMFVQVHVFKLQWTRGTVNPVLTPPPPPSRGRGLFILRTFEGEGACLKGEAYLRAGIFDS